MHYVSGPTDAASVMGSCTTAADCGSAVCSCSAACSAASCCGVGWAGICKRE